MTDMRIFVFFVFLATAASASAQIYRWTDSQGRVNFSNSPPPQGVKSTVVDPNAKEGPPTVESTECYTIRCQGERLEERERRRAEEQAKADAERSAAEAKRPRGMDFRKYLSITRGMSEGEVLGIAGEPDLKADQGVAISAPVTVPINRNFSTAARAGLVMKTYTYLPIPGEPYTTTITLVGGRVSEIERVRKF
jgi:Domain of unknown function (DUF4124)